jgi:hypothetical protein
MRPAVLRTAAIGIAVLAVLDPSWTPDRWCRCCQRNMTFVRPAPVMP